MVELAYKIILEFWAVLGEMAPYLLFGFIMAGFLSVFISPQAVERNLGGRGIWPVVKAALFGIPLPLCSCGVIPVAASLRSHGANRSSTTSFLLSTPQTGVDSILVTFSLLGPVFAVFRPLAALVTGLIGGSLVEVFDRDGKGEMPRPAQGDIGSSTGKEEHGKFYRAVQYGLVTLPQDIVKPLIVGLIVAAVIALALPDDFFAGLLGRGIWPMLAMMLAGIPIYVCATASVPVAAALMAKGISAGAALVFLMTGPATNAATITTIWKVLGKKTALIYLAAVAGCALVFGFILDYIFAYEGVPSTRQTHWMLPGYVNHISAVLLVAVLCYALFKSYTGKVSEKLPETIMARTTLTIKGMTCNHCVANVKRALEECPGVELAAVDLKAGKAYVNGEGYDLKCLHDSVEKIGYSIVK